MNIPTTGGHTPGQLSKEQIEALFDQNMLEINKMNIAAGSMIKGIIIELERDGRNTYIRLYNAVKDGHQVNYEFLEGDLTLLPRLAKALGLKQCTEDLLEVRSA